MQEQKVIETQLDFYRKGEAGCLFALHAAADPAKFEWRSSVAEASEAAIEPIIQAAISAPDVSMQSIIFPSVLYETDLKALLLLLKQLPSCFLEQEVEFEQSVCLGYRVRVGDKVS